MAQWPDDARTRDPEMHDESVRSIRGGGGPDLDAEEIVWSSQALLEQMTEEPEAVLEALDPAEQARVVVELRALADRSAGVRNETGLLHVADDIHRLVEETPALKALLLPKEMDVVEEQNERTYTLGIHEEATSSETEYVQERELQVLNEVLVNCHKTLKQKMQESLEENSEDAPLDREPGDQRHGRRSGKWASLDRHLLRSPRSGGTSRRGAGPGALQGALPVASCGPRGYRCPQRVVPPERRDDPEPPGTGRRT